MSESGGAMPTKIVFHAFHVSLYFREFFEVILFFDTMDYSPWSEREIWLFLRVAVSPKPERPCPPKSVYMHVTSTPICMNFLSQFRSIKFFDDYSPVHGQGKFGHF